jgi:hypothetical protein
MEQPGGTSESASSKIRITKLVNNVLTVVVAVFAIVLLFRWGNLATNPSHGSSSSWLWLSMGVVLWVFMLGLVIVLTSEERHHTEVQENRARRRVRQAEDKLSDALRGGSNVVLPVDAGSGQLATPHEDHAQLDPDQTSRDAAPPEGHTRVDLNRIAESLRAAQAQRESDQKIFVGNPDGTLEQERDFVVDRITEVTPDTFYGFGYPKAGVGEPGDRSNDGLTLAALWDVTHSRMDLYHEIVTRQAKRSFGAAQVAMGVGFVLLVVFAVLAVEAKTTAAAIGAGGLGAVGAAFSAYIGKTFIRSQESAASHLRAYFDQPLELSRYLAAERLLADAKELTPEQRTAILSTLVQSIATAGHDNGSAKDAKPRGRLSKGSALR